MSYNLSAVGGEAFYDSDNNLVSFFFVLYSIAPGSTIQQKFMIKPVS